MNRRLKQIRLALFVIFAVVLLIGAAVYFLAMILIMWKAATMKW